MGETIDYTFTVTNTGNVDLDNIDVSDPLLEAPNPIVAITGPTGDTGNDGVLGLSETWTYLASYTLIQDSINAGSVTNQATVTGEDPNGDEVDDLSDDDSPLEDEPTITSLPQNPDIAIVKTAVLEDGGDGFANIGDTIKFTFKITNTGNVTLSNVTLIDPKASGIDCNGFDGTLDPNEMVTCEGFHEVIIADLQAGTYNNTAVVTGDCPNGTEDCVEDEDSEITPLNPAPLSCDAPNEVRLDACSNPVDFQAWKDEFSASGGCDITITYDAIVDGIDTSGMEDLSAILMPSKCGGNIEVTINVEDQCGNSTSCTSSYRIAAVPMIQVSCPSEFMVTELLSQDSIDKLFEVWISEFGFTGGICGTSLETNLSTFSAPSFSGGTTEITYTVADDCSSDECTVSFTVPDIDPQFDMGLVGPGVICTGNAGFIYSANAGGLSEIDITWSYTGQGAEIRTLEDNMIEVSFTSDATEGDIIATIGSGLNTASNAYPVTFADARVCDVFCEGILHVSDFMMNESGAPIENTFAAELLLSSDGTVRSSRIMTFQAGLSVDLQPNFEVENGGTLKVYMEPCDQIGFRDEETYKKVKERIESITSKRK